jgi:hypothetical protein
MTAWLSRHFGGDEIQMSLSCHYVSWPDIFIYSIEITVAPTTTDSLIMQKLITLLVLIASVAVVLGDWKWYVTFSDDCQTPVAVQLVSMINYKILSIVLTSLQTRLRGYSALEKDPIRESGATLLRATLPILFTATLTAALICQISPKSLHCQLQF